MTQHCQCAHDHPGRCLQVTGDRVCGFCRLMHPEHREAERPRREAA